jgi:subtilisin family serine protease
MDNMGFFRIVFDIISHEKRLAKSIIKLDNLAITFQGVIVIGLTWMFRQEEKMAVASKNMKCRFGKTARCLVLGIVVVLIPCVCFSEGDISNSLKALSENSKLTDSQSILAEFSDGKSTSRIIVNLRQPARLSTSLNLQSGTVRKQLSTDVNSAISRVVTGIRAQEITITNRFKYVYGFSAEVTLKGLQALVNSGDVVSIEKDFIVYPNLAQGIPLMNATTARSTYSGSGLSVAICDTGIDYTHSRLGGGGFPNSKVIGGYDCGEDKSDPMDGNGHGTACAGIVAGDLGTVGDYIGGVAYGAKLYALKISNTASGGSAHTSDMIEAWEWCVTHQNDDPINPIMIISTSFGGGRYYSACDSASSAMTTAAANAVSVGMTLFVSSGNDGYCDSVGWPACISHVVSVGAVYDARFTASSIGWCVNSGSCASKISTWGCSSGWYSSQQAQSDRVIVYSNTASFLGLLAPSNWATTTKLGGSYYNTAYGFGGTSAACPYAAGAAACLQSASKTLNGSFLSPTDVESKLISSGDSVADDKVAITKPRVNVGAAVALLASCPDCPANGVITNTTYLNGTNCSCSNATALTLGQNTTVENGATATFTAPYVKVEPGFNAETGANVTIRQP